MPLGNRIIIKSRTARKDYNCDMCSGIIWEGESYSSANYYDTEYKTLRCCRSHTWKEINTHIRNVRETP